MFDNVKIVVEEAVSKKGNPYLRAKVTFADGETVYIFDSTFISKLTARLVLKKK